MIQLISLISALVMILSITLIALSQLLYDFPISKDHLIQSSILKFKRYSWIGFIVSSSLVALTSLIQYLNWIN